jgi:hypothetical protein
MSEVPLGLWQQLLETGKVHSYCQLRPGNSMRQGELRPADWQSAPVFVP